MSITIKPVRFTENGFMTAPSPSAAKARRDSTLPSNTAPACRTG